MKAMILEEITNLNENSNPLTYSDVAKPQPSDHEILIRVSVCGVCHTELDEIEGRTPPQSLPVVLGHQMIGIVEEPGAKVTQFSAGDRVGVAWIHSACGECLQCREGRENLCPDFRATGRDVNGGYAEYMTVPSVFSYTIPKTLSDGETAPMLCAGAIGYRSLRLTGLEDGKRLGLTGFGASGHLVLSMAKKLYPNSDIFVFARSAEQRNFALELGANWAGDTEEVPPAKLHAIIDTTPAWKPVVEALNNLDPGGRLVINAIRKENMDIEYLLNLDYPSHLWMEKEIKSVANVTRKDVQEMLIIAEKNQLSPEFELYPLKDANRALFELKQGGGRGAKVLKIAP